MTTTKNILFLFISSLIFGKTFSQTKSDTMKIKTCSLDYIEGWYAGDTIRMDRALHSDLTKRQLGSLKQTAGPMINTVSKSNMIEFTKAGFGKATPKDKIKNEIVILDIYEDIASVKAISYDFIDYMQLVKCNGEWKILNVLWKGKNK
jgi:hypothetical protein